MAIRTPKMYTSKLLKDKTLEYLKTLVKTQKSMFGISLKARIMEQVNQLIM